MPEKKKLASFKSIHKHFLIGLTREQWDILVKAREKMGASIAEIMRHATFKVYLPKAFEKK